MCHKARRICQEALSQCRPLHQPSNAMGTSQQVAPVMSKCSQCGGWKGQWEGGREVEWGRGKVAPGVGWPGEGMQSGSDH